ncbi:MAG: hypothetical protein CMI54_05620 [Parcubacteria group bacterium]|jgi:hypothetical protein|nr:hypothetical protein [Parcubacteria group bacterium]|tara:strand:+ start:4988 stop:5227 length:240 start_codon:yes stop_codon:yes gene_type:complete
MKFLQELAEEGFAVTIIMHFNAGFKVGFGHKDAGHIGKQIFKTAEEVEQWLMLAAVIAKPKSKFADKYRNKLPNIEDKN